MKRLKGDCLIFSIGGLAYALLEILWRQKTHWTMAVTGGACFLTLFRFYKIHPHMKMIRRCLSGSCIITAMEFLCGWIVNIKCRLNVWDYSKCCMNIKGQICPFYSVLWALLCIPINCLCRLLCKNRKIV